MIAEPARKTFGPDQEDWWMWDAGRFEPFGLTLVQAYCYLTEFADKPISDEKLTRLQESFDNLRRRGLKAVLRFAYERATGVKEGPTLDWILRHIDQLQPLLRRNVDVVYVLQAGFIGAWGEWHSAARIANDYAPRAAIIKRLLEALPEERMLQVRPFVKVPLRRHKAGSELEVERSTGLDMVHFGDAFEDCSRPGRPFFLAKSAPYPP